MDASHHLIKECCASFTVGILHLRKIYFHCQEVIGTKSWIKITQMKKAVDQKPCTDQQHEGNGDLADHQQASNSVSFATSGGITPAFFQRIVQIQMRSMHRGRQTE